MMPRNKLVVISLDSLGFRDLDELAYLVPHISQMMKWGTWVKRVRGIFPTLTFPYLDHHGAVSGSSRDRQQH